MWKAIVEEPDELHIVPQDDLIGHDTNVDCVCGPAIDLVLDAYIPGGLKIIFHVALDGREFNERDWKT